MTKLISKSFKEVLKMKVAEDRFILLMNSIEGMREEMRMSHQSTERRLIDMDRKFTDKFAEVDRRFVEMDRKFTDKFVEMDRKFTDKFVEMDKKLDNQVEIVKGKLIFPIAVMIFVAAISVVFFNPLSKMLEHLIK